MEPFHVPQRLLILAYCLSCCLTQNPLKVVYQWAELEFVFPNESARAEAIEKKWFVPGASVPNDVDVHFRDGNNSRVFVTIPRYGKGRPATLGTVDQQGKIVPYPSYDWHVNQGKNCDGINSVFRVAIDKCDRLWVMDTGFIPHLSCPPQLLAFDLKTDQLIYRHRVNKRNYLATSLFVTPVVDVREAAPSRSQCTDTFVYVSDVSGFGLLVVDVARNRSWRVTHKLFLPYLTRSIFTVEGVTFVLLDGVVGMALSPKRDPNTDRTLYFHALASTTENFVRTSVIRNDNNIDKPFLSRNSVQVFPEERPSQSSAEAMDRNGIMFFGLVSPPSIFCWNSTTEYSPRNFHRIALDEETLQFAGGVKIVDNLDGEQELWILTSSFQRVISGTLTTDRINFRIHTEKVDNLLRGSKCVN